MAATTPTGSRTTSLIVGTVVPGTQMLGPVRLRGLGSPAQVLLDRHPNLQEGREGHRGADLVHDRGQQFVGGRLEYVGQPVQMPRSVLAGEPGPAGEGRSGGADRGVDLLRGRAADGSDDLLGGRVVDRPAFAARADERSVDQQVPGTGDPVTKRVFVHQRPFQIVARGSAARRAGTTSAPSRLMAAIVSSASIVGHWGRTSSGSTGSLATRSRSCLVTSSAVPMTACPATAAAKSRSRSASAMTSRPRCA